MSDTPEKDWAHPNPTVELTLKSWDRFKTPNLRVEPSLLGAAHSFTHQGKSFKVSLPMASEATNSEKVTLDHWRGRDGDGQFEPMDYLIHSVDVSVSLPGLYTLPSVVLEQSANAFNTISAGEQIMLEQLAMTSGQLALAAFDLWLRCIRWKTGLARFGRAATVGPDTGWRNRLRDASTGNFVWTGKHRFVSPARPAISPVHWENIGIVLAAGESPPLFVDLLFDAEMHIEAGDFRRAVIDAAVAAEAYIRSTVRSVLPGRMGEESGKFMTIKTVLKKLFPEALEKSGKPECNLYSELRDIFIDRDKILHGGRVDDLTKEKCDGYVAVVRVLLADHLP